ncbi:hypothetical protein HK405_007713, partial [Cladochytrium tenue]
MSSSSISDAAAEQQRRVAAAIRQSGRSLPEAVDYTLHVTEAGETVSTRERIIT